MWETMVFDIPGYEDYEERYASYKDAVEGHLLVVKDILSKMDKIPVSKSSTVRRIR